MLYVGEQSKLWCFLTLQVSGALESKARQLQPLLQRGQTKYAKNSQVEWRLPPTATEFILKKQKRNIQQTLFNTLST